MLIIKWSENEQNQYLLIIVHKIFVILANISIEE